jgi:CRP-like cAMP-binding protein
MLTDILGWAAAAMTLLAFSMRTMIPLRMASIVANCCFISFGALRPEYSVMLLHCILLPFNILRLVQMRKLVQRVQAASRGDLQGEWLRPYARERRLAQGEWLFRRGDPGQAVFFIVQGTISLPEIGSTLGPGELLGEIALFAPTGSRSLGAQVGPDGALVLEVDAGSLRALYFQNPDFGFHLLHLMAGRMAADSQRLEHGLKVQIDAQLDSPSRGQLRA